MYLIDDIYISEDVSKKKFVCDLNKCKGACCVEGDLGAPLEDDELDKIEEVYPIIKSQLTDKAIKVIEKKGTFVLDSDGDYSTPIINGKECVYAVYDEKNHLHCAIELAWKEGKTDFRKPISCHLYPIRIQKLNDGAEAVNYDEWDICSDACSLGEQLKVPVYKFAKESLTRKYGEEWYKTLEELIDYVEKEDAKKNQ